MAWSGTTTNKRSTARPTSAGANAGGVAYTPLATSSSGGFSNGDDAAFGAGLDALTYDTESGGGDVFDGSTEHLTAGTGNGGAAASAAAGAGSGAALTGPAYSRTLLGVTVTCILLVFLFASAQWLVPHTPAVGSSGGGSGGSTDVVPAGTGIGTDSGRSSSRSRSAHGRRRQWTTAPEPVAHATLPADALEYTVMIDAGSSGSRVYLYTYRLPGDDASAAPWDVLDVQMARRRPGAGTADSDAAPASATTSTSGAPGASATASSLTDSDPLNAFVIRKVSPGLSSYAANPSQAWASLQPLLAFARQHIPPSKRAATPVYVMATAGMRLLPVADQNAILSAVRDGLRADGTFAFADDHVAVISGQYEGIYGWIALNAALRRFKVAPDTYTSTAGLVELGGASSQIAFELLHDDDPQHSTLPPELTATVDLGLGCDEPSLTTSATVAAVPAIAKPATHTLDVLNGHGERARANRFHLYVHSFLGFGANSARQKRTQQLLAAAVAADAAADAAATAAATTAAGAQTLTPAIVPVLPTGTVTPTATAGAAAPASGAPVLVPPALRQIADACMLVGQTDRLPAVASAFGARTYELVGTGDYHQCQRELEPLLNAKACAATDAPPSSGTGSAFSRRPYAGCSFDGIRQPSLASQLTADASIAPAETEFFAFSEFWYGHWDLFTLRGGYDWARFDTVSAQHCASAFRDVWSRFESGGFPHADATRVRQQCFKAAWMTTVLHAGHGFSAGPNALASACDTTDDATAAAAGTTTGSADAASPRCTYWTPPSHPADDIGGAPLTAQQRVAITPIQTLPPHGEEVQWTHGAVLAVLTDRLRAFNIGARRKCAAPAAAAIAPVATTPAPAASASSVHTGTAFVGTQQQHPQAQAQAQAQAQQQVQLHLVPGFVNVAGWVLALGVVGVALAALVYFHNAKATRRRQQQLQLQQMQPSSSSALSPSSSPVGGPASPIAALSVDASGASSVAIAMPGGVAGSDSPTAAMQTQHKLL